MSKRIPPSPEQLIEVLDRWHAATAHLWGDAPRLIPYKVAAKEITQAFRTSPMLAHRWIESARAAGALVTVHTDGKFGGLSVLAQRPGRDDGKLWWTTPSEAGYHPSEARDRRDTDWLMKVDGVGRWTDDDTAGHVEQQWLTTPATLAAFVRFAEDHLNAYRVGREAEQVLTGATMDHVHADAVDLIRGLLDAAELLRHPTRREIDKGYARFETSIMDVGRGAQTHVDIHLSGEAIDKLGEVLRTLGVPPVRPAAD